MTHSGEFQIAVNVKVEEADSFLLRDRSLERPDVFQWILVLGLSVVLIFAVLAFGAVYEWSIFALEASTLILFLIWSARQLWLSELRLSNNPLYLPALLFAGLILAQVLLRR